MIRRALVACLLALPFSAAAELHLFVYAEAKTGIGEVAFSPIAEGKTPRDCAERAKKLMSEQGRTLLEGSLTPEDLANVKSIVAKCIRTHMIFTEPADELNHIYLVRFVSGMPSLTKMSSEEGCLSQQRLYTSVAGREAYCARSSQDIIYE